MFTILDYASWIAHSILKSAFYFSSFFSPFFFSATSLKSLLFVPLQIAFDLVCVYLHIYSVFFTRQFVMGMGKMVLHLKLQYSKARETNWYTLCYSTVLGEKKLSMYWKLQYMTARKTIW